MSESALRSPTNQPQQDSTVISEENLNLEKSQKNLEDSSSKSKETTEPDSKPEEEKPEKKDSKKPHPAKIINQYFDLQKSLYESGDLKGSLEMCEKAIELTPNNPFLYNLYGERLLELERYDDALTAYNKALELDPNLGEAISNKGYLLYLIGRKNIEEANALYDKGLELFKDDFVTLLKKGKILYEIGNIEEAKKLFDSACDIISKGKLEDSDFEYASGMKINLNKHEVELVKLVNEFKKIPVVKPSKEETREEQEQKAKIHELELKLMAMAAELNKKSEKEIAEIKKQIEDISKKQEDLIKENEDSGVKELAAMRRKVRELEDKAENEQIIFYYKTFYWTTINLLQGYRQISTGLIKVDFENLENNEPSPFKIAKDILAIAKRIPFVKDYIANVVTLIEEIVNIKEQNQINAINKIMRAKFRDESEINVTIIKLAFAITKEREEEILHPDLVKSISVQRGTTWLVQQLTTLKTEILKSIEIIDPKSNGAMLALQDATLLIAYMSVNYKTIIESDDPLEKQIESMIKKDGLDTILEKKGRDITIREDRDVQVKCISCNIF